MHYIPLIRVLYYNYNYNMYIFLFTLTSHGNDTMQCKYDANLQVTQLLASSKAH